VNSTGGFIVWLATMTAIPLGQFVRKNRLQGKLGRRLSRSSRIFWLDHSVLPLRSSKSHERIVGRILDASIVFVQQPDRFECLVAQHKAVLVFRLQRIKNDI
jgi:hypothetical protein